MQITLNVNGQDHEMNVAPGARLIDVLRGQLGLTGTKQGCRAGECGACTVLVGGRPVQACIMLAVQATGEVLTIEGLSDAYFELKKAFADEGGFQCGFCTPGQLMHAVAILATASPRQMQDEAWLRDQLSGNICRCTGYSGIIRALSGDAVRRIASRLRGDRTAALPGHDEPGEGRLAVPSQNHDSRGQH